MKIPSRPFALSLTVLLCVVAVHSVDISTGTPSFSSVDVNQVVDFILNLGGKGKEKISSSLVTSLLKQIPDVEKLKSISREKGFEKITSLLLKGFNDNVLDLESLGLNSEPEVVLDLISRYLASKAAASSSLGNEIDGDDGREGEDLHSQLMDLAKMFFRKKFGNVDFDSLSSVIGDLPQPEWMGMNATSTDMWMMAKSMWQRILAYIEEESSLQLFMQMTPVKVIDRVFTLGDELNLANFLVKKLKPELADFMTGKINPYLGPLRDFDSFYNFTKEHDVNGILDYLSSEKFIFTMSAMSRIASAYMDDTISEDVVDQFIDFISFNNTALRNFYKSFIDSQHKNKDSDRLKRDVLQNIANSYKPYGSAINYGSSSSDYSSSSSEHGSSNNGYSASSTDYSPYNNTPLNGRQYASRYGLPGNFNPAVSYDPARDGGYGGGGGYGYGVNMNSLDPYVVLGALALGTILGFLLFRALRGTRNGRRDIGDGSLSLWLSDMPGEHLAEGAALSRMKRQSGEKDGEFNLPASLRGDVFSADPLVGDDLVDEALEEDDIADHLNQLWDVYYNNNETSCIHSHLCSVVANRTAEHLTGKDSGIALLMASLSNMMGLEGSGRLIDEVANNLVVGGAYSCPVASGCNLLI